MLDSLDEKVGVVKDAERGDENKSEAGEIVLSVPQRMMRKLIGKAGSVIREMRENSGASIEVKETGTNCSVIIRGGKEQRDKAVKMVGDLNNNSQAGMFLSKDLRGVSGEKTSPPQVTPITYKTEAPPAWGSIQYGSAVEAAETENEKQGALIDWDNLNANREEMERQRWEHLPELFKDFYEEHKDVTTRGEEEVALHRKMNNNIEVRNFNEEDTSPFMKPVTTFGEAFHNFPDILSTIKKQGFTTPSPIQSQAGPTFSQGRT